MHIIGVIRSIKVRKISMLSLQKNIFLSHHFFFNFFSFFKLIYWSQLTQFGLKHLFDSNILFQIYRALNFKLSNTFYYVKFETKIDLLVSKTIFRQKRIFYRNFASTWGGGILSAFLKFFGYCFHQRKER